LKEDDEDSKEEDEMFILFQILLFLMKIFF